MNKEFITRFAPSPTGKFHIGSARTALFNYLFAKHNGGKFLLRIEDTDRARSSDEHIDDIKNSLDWLGLHWDNKDSEHYQSRRIDEYQKVAKLLIDKGCAYKKDGAVYLSILKTQQYLGDEIYISGKHISKATEPYPFPAFNDLIHGYVTIFTEEDFVILKSDGWPTFHLSVVVDDHDMGVTHIIRGDDHLSNTPKHILIYRALGWKLPRWGHLPLILNTDRSKMSKRKDPVSVTDDFKARGFLPEAMVNYLVLLGWNPKTNEEFFTLDRLVEKFMIEDVQKSNAVFDMGKLLHFNTHYLRQKTVGEIVALAKPYWQEQFDISKFDDEYLQKVAKLTSERTSTCEELGKDVGYFFMPPKLDVEKLIFKKSTKEATQRGLRGAVEALEAIVDDDWRKEYLLAALTGVVEREKLSNGDVFWPVRYALSGFEASPRPEELLEVLGKKESLKRIKTAVDLIEN